MSNWFYLGLHVGVSVGVGVGVGVGVTAGVWVWVHAGLRAWGCGAYSLNTQ